MKKALVTGASSGIGEAIAKMLTDAGYEVYGIGRDFHKTFENDAFHKVVCDLLEREKLVKTVEKINENHDISLFVSSAGVGYYGLHEELNPEKIHEVTTVNLEVPMIITNMLLRDLKKNKGAIVFISSITAQEINPHGCAYGASKAGLTSFAHSLFAEARKYGVRVINIEPDMTRTGLYRNADFECAESEEAALDPVDVASALKDVLDKREGLVVRDISLLPQIHRIEKKSR